MPSIDRVDLTLLYTDGEVAARVAENAPPGDFTLDGPRVRFAEIQASQVNDGVVNVRAKSGRLFVFPLCDLVTLWFDEIATVPHSDGTDMKLDDDDDEGVGEVEFH